MSYLINMLVLIVFAFIGLIFIWYLTSRNKELIGVNKLFIMFFILLLILTFVVWGYMKEAATIW